jgi:murein L,D-transpeptidase YcbB/YkuD
MAVKNLARRLTRIAVLSAGCFSLIGCDYWPPALQAEIEMLRADLNDALDDRQRIDQELQDIRSQQSALQREVEEKIRMNEELQHRIAKLTAVAKQPRPTPRKIHGGPEVQSSPVAQGSYPILRLGNPMTEGPRVIQLQRLLRRHGIPIRVDGRYGPTTAAAVRGFQRSRGLPADGMVGPATYTALRRTEPAVRLVRHLWLQRPPLTGHDVRHLQRTLRRLGYRVTVDGHYGQETYLAVTRFQQKCGLEPDGIVGLRTWTCMKIRN